MAMLSRVAERVYWAARYLERIENTARLVNVYANLLFDLPRGIDLSWYNMITLNSAEEAFNERYKVRDERNVIKFILADEGYVGSLDNSLRWARENIRTTRDVIPEESWELINELNLFVSENIQQGINRGGRHEFLEQIIESCQRISGLWAGTMLHGDAWDIMRCGRNLERADMATRLLDAGAAVLLQSDVDDETINLGQVVWGNVLTSASGYHSYLRKVQDEVNGPAVAEFLILDRQFPRSLQFCISQMMMACTRLPNAEAVEKRLRQIHRKIGNTDYSDVGEEFQAHMNDLQLMLASVHQLIAEAWFPRALLEDSAAS